MIDIHDTTPQYTIRRARKAHRCDHARWRKRVGKPAICSGTIEPGESYAESYEFGEPYHPARYHLQCWAEEIGEAL